MNLKLRRVCGMMDASSSSSSSNTCADRVTALEANDGGYSLARAHRIIAHADAQRKRIIGGGIPFYMYDVEDGIDWLSWHDESRKHCAAWSNTMYRADFWFLSLLRDHPWRAREPGRASLFVVPVIVDTYPSNLCNISMPGKRQWDLITRSPFYQNYPERHLIMAPTPGMLSLTALRKRWAPFGAAGCVGRVENNAADNAMAVPYVIGAWEEPASAADYISASRPIGILGAGDFTSYKVFGGYFIRNSLVAQLAAAGHSNQTLPLSMLVVATKSKVVNFPHISIPATGCGPLKVSSQSHTGARVCLNSSYDPIALAKESQFILAPRGDLHASPRYAEALQAGAIPIFIADDIWKYALPFQCLVPWQLFSISVAEAAVQKNATDALVRATESLDPAGPDGLARQAFMRTLMNHFKRDVLWRTSGSRVAENVLIEAKRMVDGCPAAPWAGHNSTCRVDRQGKKLGRGNDTAHYELHRPCMARPTDMASSTVCSVPNAFGANAHGSKGTCCLFADRQVRNNSNMLPSDHVKALRIEGEAGAYYPPPHG